MAQKFTGAYAPDSENAVLALNATSAIPESMQGIENAQTLLQIRKYDDYPFNSNPVAEISKINQETGKQIVQFVTRTECSIQTNACMKPIILSDGDLQPPPAFEQGEASQECYFEVKLVSSVPGNIGIGFASCPFPSFRLPGFAETSIGYHSKDGKVYQSDYDEKGVECGEPLAKDDILGAGYRIVEMERVGDHILNQTVFYFTRNGTRIGDEFVTEGFYPDKIYPTIGTTGNCSLEVTFGKLSEVFYPPTEFKVNTSETPGELTQEQVAESTVIEVDSQ
ncbi:Rsp5p-dependent ubiquitination, sorting of cargo proteins at the multivesicular body [Terramyces sp. JEL0728]|nr:Rsp5p-dependent ubiquitination, sorting of cargo proteins at the multivesicular body [Terramyces sp. JEL0728]